MMNKMYLFIIASIILGLIISYYYNNKFDKIFVSMFIMITIIFFILFYFLGNKANIEYEKFSNQSHRSHKLMSNISNEHFNLQQLHSVLNEIDTEEENMHHVMHPQEEQIHHVIHPEEEQIHHIMHSEEEPHHIIHPEEEEPQHNKYPITLVPTDDSDKLSKDIAEGYGPISINISYNAQNSTNTLSDGIHESDTNNSTKSPDNNNTNNTNNNKNKNRKSKNLGPINYDPSRIYNNSDWVYGSNAWTNDPDYYIPTKNCPSTIVPVDPKPLNELAMRQLEGNNEACPIEINVPWSQWKSGDSDPEPFNL
jgi:hypothetical protein